MIGSRILLFSFRAYDREHMTRKSALLAGENRDISEPVLNHFTPAL